MPVYFCPHFGSHLLQPKTLFNRNAESLDSFCDLFLGCGCKRRTEEHILLYKVFSLRGKPAASPNQDTMSNSSQEDFFFDLEERFAAVMWVLLPVYLEPELRMVSSEQERDNYSSTYKHACHRRVPAHNIPW